MPTKVSFYLVSNPCDAWSGFLGALDYRQITPGAFAGKLWYDGCPGKHVDIFHKSSVSLGKF